MSGFSSQLITVTLNLKEHWKQLRDEADDSGSILITGRF